MRGVRSFLSDLIARPAYFSAGFSLDAGAKVVYIYQYIKLIFNY